MKSITTLIPYCSSVLEPISAGYYDRNDCYIPVLLYRNISIMQERMRESDTMVLTTMKIDSDLLMQLKLAALQEHKSVRLIVSSLIEQYLGERRNRKSDSGVGRTKVTGNHQLTSHEGGHLHI